MLAERPVLSLNDAVLNEDGISNLADVPSSGDVSDPHDRVSDEDQGTRSHPNKPHEAPTWTHYNAATLTNKTQVKATCIVIVLTVGVTSGCHAHHMCHEPGRR